MGDLSTIKPFKDELITEKKDKIGWQFQKWLDLLWKALAGNVIINGTLEVGLINGIGQPTLGMPQATTSGTEKDFTGIPSWVTQITVCLNGVSTSSTDNVIIQLGDAGGIETSGYLSTSSSMTDAASPNVTSRTDGFVIFTASAAAVRHGSVTLTLLDSSAFEWVANGVISRTDAARSITVSGSKSLSAALTTVRITTTGGTDTFDAGKVNVRYS